MFDKEPWRLIFLVLGLASCLTGVVLVRILKE
jgi:hypothetical protein